LPIYFDKAYAVVDSATITYVNEEAEVHKESKEEIEKAEIELKDAVYTPDDFVRIPEDFKQRFFYFTLVLDQLVMQSAPSREKKWIFIEKNFFEGSSMKMKDSVVKVCLFEKHLLGESLLGEGETSIVDLLKAGYNSPVTIPIALRKVKNDESGIPVYHLMAKILISMYLREDHHSPTPTGSGISGRKKRESILYELAPDACVLKAEHFLEEKALHISDTEARAVLFESIENIDRIVGYQIELFSRSTGNSKGVWVIAGVKKFRFSDLNYLLKNQSGLEKWVVLQKAAGGSGKPFTLRRKVASFS
jgi:hypothetical protein